MGKDDITGEDLIQRVDDQPETVRKRLEKYERVSYIITFLHVSFCCNYSQSHNSLSLCPCIFILYR